MPYSGAWQDSTDVLIFVIFNFTLINLHFPWLLRSAKKLPLTHAPSLGCLLRSAAGWYYRDYVDCYYRFKQQVMPRALTYGGGEVGDSFSFFSVVVDGQVPDARVHVLDKACVVCGDGYQAPLHGHGPLQTVNVLGEEPPPIQKLHKVKLQTDTQKVRKTDRWTADTPLE